MPDKCFVSMGSVSEMPVALYVVHTSVDPARDAEFNHWYNTQHCPDILRFRGAVSARRYRKILGDDPHQYIAVYEFQDEETLRAWRESDIRGVMYAEHQARFGPFDEPTRSGYVQVWP